VVEDFSDDGWLGNEPDDTHPLAATAKKRVDLVDASDELGPRFPADRKPGTFGSREILQAVNPANGLVSDTTREDSPASIAVVGFALASYPAAVERGWMTRADAVARSLAALRFFHGSDQSGSPDATGYKGFYYHFLNLRTGIRVDDFLRTSNARIYAAGDVCLEHKYTHTADAAADIVVRNALCRGRQRLSSLVIPWCTYTDPEIAHVGLYVRQAHEQDLPVKTFTIPMHDLTRAITDGEEVGFVKIHVKEGTDRILGATIVARHAGEMINEITLAMVAGIGLRTLSHVIHAYPTQAEAIRKAADACGRTRSRPTVRSRLRRWLARGNGNRE
jgi:hypothetical protein